MRIDLSGKIVVVTGAASGIGAACARAAVASGATCLLTDKDARGLVAVADETGADHVTVDLAARDAADRIAQAALAAHGRIDALVNAAGVTDRASVADGDLDAWDRIFAINARAPFALMQMTIRDLLKRGMPGQIVNIGSVNAHCGAPDLGIYAASKGALSTLTRNAANAHMADRIRVNTINLGWVATPHEDRMQSTTLGNGPDWLAKAVTGMPLGRLVEAEEAARLALWLLSDLSAPMTGLCLDLEQRVTGAP